MGRGPAARRIAATGLGAAVLLLTAGAACAQAAPPAPGSGALFDQAFGQRRARAPQKLSVPVQLDGRELGMLDVQLAGEQVRVARVQFAALLATLLRPEVHARLADAAGGAWVTPDELAALDLRAVYSPQRIALDLEVPLAQRVTQTLRLAGGLVDFDQPREAWLRPEPASLIANARWIEARDDGVRRARLALDGAGRVGDWVLEGYGSAALDATAGGFVRGDTRLVRDWPAQALRLSAGDVTTAPSGSLPAQALGGLRLARLFSLDPVLVTQPLPAQGVGLPAGGSLDVLVNGFVVRTLRLGPGVYDLRNIPVFTGANDVVVRIVEPGGRISEQRRGYFFDPALLAEGLQDWDVAIGRPVLPGGGARSYQGGSPLVHAWWRRGWTPHVTAGAGLQRRARDDGLAQVAQVEATWASPAGTWAAWHAVSTHPAGHGTARSLQWRLATPVTPLPGVSATLVLQAQRRSQDFATVDASAAGGASRDLGVRAGAAWSDGWGATLAWARRDAAATGTAQTLGATLRRRLDRHWSMEGGASREHGANAGHTVFVQLRYSGETDPAGTAVRGALAFDSREQRWQADAQAGGIGRVAGADAPWRLAVQRVQARAGSQDTVAGEVATGRGEVTWNHTRAITSGVGTELSEVTFAASLVATSAGLQVGPPVTDSAAVLAPRAGLAGLKLLVDPQRSGAAASSDAFGSPVLRDLVAYQPRPVQLDAERLPPGRSLGNDRPVLLPAYRSVVVVPVGSDANTQVSGMLVGAQGEPLGLQALQLVPQAGATVELFTNRRGGFTSAPLGPGRYRLQRPGDAQPLRLVDIGPKEEGMQDLGRVIAREQP